MNSANFKNAAKAAIFAVILAALLAVSSRVLTPLFENSYDTVHGFYDQPDDTIDTLFLGTSVVKDGISPMELYEDYGICAYSLSTSGQPVMASYYWLLEAYSHHSGTLKSVVLDVSSLRHTWDFSKYRVAFSEMRLSPNKFRAVRDIADSLDLVTEYMVPSIAYHTRWKELDRDGFDVLSGYTEEGMRGFWLTESQAIESMGYEDIAAPEYLEDPAAGTEELYPESVLYLERIRAFCLEKGLTLILIKTPTSNWTDTDHNSVQALAEEYSLAFLDFNYDPLLSETGISLSCDTQEGEHLNYRGAFRLTGWLGSYLSSECGAADRRGDGRFGFMDEDLALYKRNTILTELNEADDPVSFLEAALEYSGFAVFITVRGDCAESLSESQREAFRDMGLDRLSEIGRGSAYLAVIRDGTVIYEASSSGADEGSLSADASGTLSFSGVLPDGAEYLLASGGYESGNISSCMIGDTECSAGARGINIAVYDYERSILIKHLEFDTAAAPKRARASTASAYKDLLEAGTAPEDLQGVYRKLYLYNIKCMDAYRAKSLHLEEAPGLKEHLEQYLADDQYIVLLASQGTWDASGMNDASGVLESFGFDEAAALRDGGSFAAIAQGEMILAQDGKPRGTAAKARFVELCAAAGTDPGPGSSGLSSLYFNNENLSPQENGINLVIYNRTTGLAADAECFQ